MKSASTLNRRASHHWPEATPQAIADSYVTVAEQQLAAAREGLIAARKRVVTLEEALGNWRDFAEMVRANARRERSAASN